jgi:hypothetical protein
MAASTTCCCADWLALTIAEADPDGSAVLSPTPGPAEISAVVGEFSVFAR